MTLDPMAPRGSGAFRHRPVENASQVARPGQAENQAAGAAAEPQTDEVQLSPQAKALAQGEPVPSHTLSSARLRDISRRLDSPYYDSDQVLDSIVRHLGPELERTS
jgi:hypothetical protein